MATRTLPPGTRTTTQRRADDAGFCIEYAKSGRAMCTECSKKIANKEMRLGVSFQYSQNQSWKWQHWACVTEGTISKVGSPDKLQGLGQLERKDQEAVRQRFAGAGKAPKKRIHGIFD